MYVAFKMFYVCVWGVCELGEGGGGGGVVVDGAVAGKEHKGHLMNEWCGPFRLLDAKNSMMETDSVLQ